MADRIVTSIVYCTLWTIGLIGLFLVIYDVFVWNLLGTSQRAFAVLLFTLSPISYIWIKERQDV